MAAEETSFKTKVLKSFLWLGTGTLIGQLISWVSTIFVIRLLLPADYGLMAMATTFIALLTTISELGISAALIQAERINDKEIRQIFGLVVVSSFIGWMLCYIAAPLIASFYKEDKLVSLIRVMNFNFIFIALYIIPQSLFIREMNFKTKAKIDISAQVVASLLTLILAWKGIGVWSLVAGLIALHAMRAVGFNMARSSWLNPMFNFQGSGKLVKYGITVTGDRLLYYFYTQTDNIIIGKFLGNTVLGIYAIALNLASIPMEKVLPIITQVSFTSYSRIQNDLERIRRNILRATHTIAFSGFPLFFGMAGIAPEAIPLLLGPKWVTIIVPFQLLCLILPLKALNNVPPPAVFAVGKPKVNLVNMAIASLSMAIALLIGVKGGLLGICFAWISVYPIVFLVTSMRCLKVLGISLRQFLSEIAFPFFASTIMLILILLLKKIIPALQPMSTLIILTMFSITFYFGLAMLFKKEEYAKLKSLLKNDSS
jgi:teichuronic acid exporter